MSASSKGPEGQTAAERVSGLFLELNYAKAVPHCAVWYFLKLEAVLTLWASRSNQPTFLKDSIHTQGWERTAAGWSWRLSLSPELPQPRNL